MAPLVMKNLEYGRMRTEGAIPEALRVRRF